jgi:hypothetical protein
MDPPPSLSDAPDRPCGKCEDFSDCGEVCLRALLCAAAVTRRRYVNAGVCEQCGAKSYMESRGGVCTGNGWDGCAGQSLWASERRRAGALTIKPSERAAFRKTREHDQ